MSDIIGKQIGSFFIIRKLSSKKRNSYLYECRCKCNNIIYKAAHEIRKLKSCGHKCQIKYPNLENKIFGRLKVIKRIEKRIRGNIAYLCECKCGKQITVTSYALRSNNTRSCGCLSIDKNASYVGENNPNYIDGRSLLPDYDRHRQTSEYKKWSRTILIRDQNKCQICGNDKGSNHEKLEVHHINSYRYFPELRTNIENGITLCFDCHNLFHSKYKYPATRQKFLEFILHIYKGKGHVPSLYSQELKNSIKDLEKEYINNIGAE